ncbi:hypothetical protein CWI35_09910 [[Bacillus] caldolyticus]|uniref:Uncharacterized protein n=1 Tax=Bacillus caldolyticus TaxID=1394 RepID=A0ABM6QMZ1_BACCL|nr:hypothetical protein CWI35_09910 [[Bacillus] caldolyticus]
MREKLLHFPCVSRIHSTSERKNPPDFRWEGAKCEFGRNGNNDKINKQRTIWFSIGIETIFFFSPFNSTPGFLAPGAC